ncbi:hypothetical protein [Pelagibius sp. 7325]|uniref:hypothetical protein n=1 Tax=Pelagibius sp. 7325 TaxID=3131994 RepID=UPI0030EE5907
MTRRRVLPLRRVFGVPLAIAFVTLAGLVAALLGDGLLNALSWTGLTVPLAVILWAWLYRRQ